MQAAHAVLEAVRAGVLDSAGPVHPNFVLCGVPGLPHLLKAADHLLAAGVRFHTWTDSLFADQPTAICTEPLSGERRRPLRRYPLLKETDRG